MALGSVISAIAPPLIGGLASLLGGKDKAGEKVEMDPVDPYLQQKNRQIIEGIMNLYRGGGPMQGVNMYADQFGQAGAGLASGVLGRMFKDSEGNPASFNLQPQTLADFGYKGIGGAFPQGGASTGMAGMNPYAVLGGINKGQLQQPQGQPGTGTRQRKPS